MSGKLVNNTSLPTLTLMAGPPFGIGLIAHFVLVVIQLKHNGPCGPKRFWAPKPKTNLEAQYERFV